MPLRKTPIVTGQTYHVFNRGVNKQPILFTPRDYNRAVDTIKYYIVNRPPLPYSKFIKLTREAGNEVSTRMLKGEHGVKLISYVLMPNHFHFILTQLIDEGITNFIRNLQISITKYINTKNNRSGPLLQGQFKVVLIEDDEQLIHVCRYVHLNPYTSFIVNNIEELKSYNWSSLREFLSLTDEEFCTKDIILSTFKNKIDKYWDFISNQADYQRKLGAIKHLILE